MDEILVLQATLWAAGAFVIYAVLSRGLFMSAEKLRSRALNLAVELDSARDFPDDEKVGIRIALGQFHSGLAAWRVAFSAVRFLFIGPFRRAPKAVAYVGMSTETLSKFNAFRTYWIISTITNSLAATILFALAALLSMAFSKSTDALKSFISGGNNHDHHNHARA